MDDRTRALRALGIPDDYKVILTLDGGGIRGVMTLQLLMALERTAGMPCYEFVDLLAGSSTGGIIAGLIAAGKRAEEIAELYRDLVRDVFEPRNLASHRFANPPRYTKKNYASSLKDVLGDLTLKDVCERRGVDLVITAKDVAAGEETFFGYFNGLERNTYEDALLRAVLEATMSAPTYFRPLERFVDGGVTAHNNPALSALLEAVQYGPPDAYRVQNVVLLSFGTGCRPLYVAADDVETPEGPDALFWLKWLMTEAGNDASDLQTYLLRSKRIFPQLDFRRFQVALNEESIRRLPNEQLHTPVMGKRWIREFDDKELCQIALDEVEYVPLMEAIGRAVVAYIEADAAERGIPPFARDLLNERGKEALVYRPGAKDVARIKSQMSQPTWLDGRRR